MERAAPHRKTVDAILRQRGIRRESFECQDGSQRQFIDDRGRWIPSLEVSEQVEVVMSVLDDNERLVIRGRFWNEDTFKNLAATLGVTDDRARQIERRAIRKMQCSGVGGN